MIKNIKLKRRKARHKRILGKIGLSSLDKKRVMIRKTNLYVYVDIIDDLNKKILKSFDTRKLKKASKTEQMSQLAKIVADYLNENNIKKIVFDRNGYKYHGILSSFADNLRSQGIIF